MIVSIAGVYIDIGMFEFDTDVVHRIACPTSSSAGSLGVSSCVILPSLAVAAEQRTLLPGHLPPARPGHE